MADKSGTLQDRPPNFRDDDGNLFLVRCFKCDGKYGRENHAGHVAMGICAFCGWVEITREDDDEQRTE